jgi:hypothetical protein
MTAGIFLLQEVTIHSLTVLPRRARRLATTGVGNP